MTRRRLPRALRVVAVNLAFMLALAELVALAGYFYRTGELYYLAPPSGRSVPLDLQGDVGQYRLHPYFGFVNRPSAPALNTNNYGFVSGHDYPYERRRPEEYVVGLFGGSVAAALARFEAEHGVLAPLLAETLGRLPSGRPREVTVLNFAHAGYKQPQQLLVYDYFRALGLELDLVVNVDGFNEIALAGRNVDSGVAAEMPSFDHLGALADVAGRMSGLDSLERMLAARVEWRKFARTFNRAWSGDGWELRLASGFLADFLVYKYHLRRYRAAVGRAAVGEHEAAERDGESWLALAAPPGRGASELERAVAVWARASELLGRAQEDAGGAYLHAIQPNQYHATVRVFGAEERAVAFSDASPFAEHVRRGYPRLAAEIEPLSRRGVHVVSLLALFDGVPEPVYTDDCCHYNDAGQRLLAEAIARAFARGAHPDPAPPARSGPLSPGTALDRPPTAGGGEGGG
jgi:hypothetical protein